MVMHIDAKPFANKQLNTIETAGLGILFLSLYNGMFFFWNLLDEDGLNVLAWITISVNIYYAFWVMGAVCEDMLHRHPLGKKSGWEMLQLPFFSLPGYIVGTILFDPSGAHVPQPCHVQVPETPEGAYGA
jgi:hypothetical protein